MISLRDLFAILFMSSFFAVISCSSNRPSAAKTLFAKDNLLAWCIVPYDTQERSPEERAKMLKDLGFTKYDIGIIYNFHHAHDQINDFATLLDKMKPYLWTVNLNGMRAAGPKILPLGHGDRELEMLRALKESGFNGTIGILGHVEDEDARVVLERNLSGLQTLLKAL